MSGHRLDLPEVVMTEPPAQQPAQAEPKKAGFSRFDVILVFVLAFAVALVAINEWNIIHGYAQLISNVWTFAGTITGGEIITFSLYRIAKQSGFALPKAITAKHSAVKELDEGEAK